MPPSHWHHQKHIVMCARGAYIHSKTHRHCTAQWFSDNTHSHTHTHDRMCTNLTSENITGELGKWMNKNGHTLTHAHARYTIHIHMRTTLQRLECVCTHTIKMENEHTLNEPNWEKKTNIKRVEEEDGKNTHIKRASERVRRVSFIDWIFWCCSRTGREEYRRIEAESVLPFAYLLTYIKSTHFTRFTLSHRNRRHNKIIIIKKDTNTHDREWEREREKK